MSKEITTGSMLKPAPTNKHVEIDEDDENITEDDMIMMSKRSIYDKVHDMAEKFASTRIGQFIIERGDRLLKTIETTAKWSLPQVQENKLVRPLPWIPFLMLIINLRLMRMWLSVGALMIGNGPIKAEDVVYFIQTRRRKLRAIRVHGLKSIRRREIEKMRANSPNSSLMFKIRQLMSTIICRPGLHCEPGRTIFIERVRRNMSNSNKAMLDVQASKRRRDEEELIDMNLTCDQLLNKYANEDSEDDSDFIPNPEDETGDSTSSTTSSSEDEEQEEEKYENGVKSTSEDVTVIESNKKEASTDGDGKEQMKTPTTTTTTTTTVENGSKTEHERKDNEHEVAKKSFIPTSSVQSNKMPLINGHDKKTMEKTTTATTTTGNESANIVKTKIPSSFETTGMAGSPIDFNIAFKPSTPIQTSINNITAYSTPKSSEDISTIASEQSLTEPTAATDPIENENVLTKSNQQTPQNGSRPHTHYHHHNHNQNRYRGKNRR